MKQFIDTRKKSTKATSVADISKLWFVVPALLMAAVAIVVVLGER